MLHYKQVGSVAQWITRLTTDQKIPGSNPGRLEDSYLFWKEHIHEFGFLVEKVLSNRTFLLRRLRRAMNRKTLSIVNSKVTKKIYSSPAGNRTPVSRVTGGDTYHYTTEELCSPN